MFGILQGQSQQSQQEPNLFGFRNKYNPNEWYSTNICWMKDTYMCLWWDGWMASPIQWTWIWANSGRWWGMRPTVLSVHGVVQSWTQLGNWTRTVWLSVSAYLKSASSEPFEGGILPNPASDALCQHCPWVILLAKPPSSLWCSVRALPLSSLQALGMTLSLQVSFLGYSLLPQTSQGHFSPCNVITLFFAPTNSREAHGHYYFHCFLFAFSSPLLFLFTLSLNNGSP